VYREVVNCIICGGGGEVKCGEGVVQYWERSIKGVGKELKEVDIVNSWCSGSSKDSNCAIGVDGDREGLIYIGMDGIQCPCQCEWEAGSKRGSIFEWGS
jgi:hypothetical protein